MQSDTRNLLVGVVIGTAIGLTAAVLLAPSPGVETRGRLREKSEQTKEKTRDIIDRGRGYVESTKAHIHEAVEAGRRAAEEKRAELEAEVKAASI